MRNGDVLLVYASLCTSVVIYRYLRRRVRHEELTDPVSFSCRVIAAYRAVESREHAALFRDPLAEALAGTSAIEQVMLELADKKASSSGRTFCLTRFAMRTRWIDDRILHAIHPSRELQVRQVVVLGAGMDTRPWRLHLPAGINWFEVDMPDVVQAKRRSLTEVNAQTTRMPQPGVTKGYAYDIHTANYCTFAADLQTRGWVEQLENEGWFRSVPTLWLAEGLLMYLEQAASEQLLQDMSGNSAQGSVLLVQLFLESAKSFNDDRYGNAKSAGLKRLKDTFKSAVPDDYNEYLRSLGWCVETGMKLKELHSLVAPTLEGDDEFELGNGNAAYVEASSC